MEKKHILRKKEKKKSFSFSISLRNEPTMIMILKMKKIFFYFLFLSMCFFSMGNNSYMLIFALFLIDISLLERICISLR